MQTPVTPPQSPFCGDVCMTGNAPKKMNTPVIAVTSKTANIHRSWIVMSLFLASAVNHTHNSPTAVKNNVTLGSFRYGFRLMWYCVIVASAFVMQ